MNNLLIMAYGEVGAFVWSLGFGFAVGYITTWFVLDYYFN